MPEKSFIAVPNPRPQSAPHFMSSALAQINDSVWFRLPRRAGSISLTLSGVLTDGIYLSAWPLVGALILPLVFGIGLYLGWNQSGDVYIYSLVTMVFLVLVSQHGAAIGLWLWLGYALGDLFYATQTIEKLTWLMLASRALADALLTILLIVVPLATHALTRSSVRGLISYFEAVITPTNSSKTASAWNSRPRIVNTRSARLLSSVLLQSLMAFVFVYLWAQAVGLLLQPFYLWQNIGPR